MGVSKVVSVEGWTLDPEEVREIASEVSIPVSVPLPRVIVVDDSQDKLYRDRPGIHTSLGGRSSSGYFITIPERSLEKVGEDNYELGSSAREDLRHELVHYSDYLVGGHVGREEDPYERALKEVSVEVRAGSEDLPRALANIVAGLISDYGLKESYSLKIVSSAARKLGVDSKIVSDIRKLFKEEYSNKGGR